MIIISTIASMQPTVKPQNAQACDKAMKMEFVFNFLAQVADHHNDHFHLHSHHCQHHLAPQCASEVLEKRRRSKYLKEIESLIKWFG